MKSSLILIAIVGSVIAAPTQDNSEIDTQRTKKSPSYAPPSYGPPPCASNSYAPVALYLGPKPLAPQYREDDHKEEHEEINQRARSYAPLPGPGYSSSSYGAGPAVGLFPNARVGGCNVPLLLSCSPSVIAGHIAESHSYAAPAYRSHEIGEEPKKETEWSGKAASHHVVSQDYPDPNQGNHHVVSKDYPLPNVTRITIATAPAPENESTKKQ